MRRTSLPYAAVRSLEANKADGLISCLSERIAALAVLRNIQPLELVLVAHAQAHRPVYYLQYPEGYDERIEAARAYCYRLLQEELRVAEEEAVCACGVNGGRREKARGDGAPDAAHAVYAEGIERIVIAEERLYPGYRQIADHACHQSQQYRRYGADKARSGRYRDEARHYAGGEPQHGRLAPVHPLSAHPRERGGRGGRVGHEKGGCGEAVRAKRAPGVEAEPPEPEEPGAQYSEREVMRHHQICFKALSLSDDKGRCQGSRPGAYMDHCAAREVQRAESPEPAANAPYPVGERAIDDRSPEGREDDEG